VGVEPVGVDNVLRDQREKEAHLLLELLGVVDLRVGSQLHLPGQVLLHILLVTLGDLHDLRAIDLKCLCHCPRLRLGLALEAPLLHFSVLLEELEELIIGFPLELVKVCRVFIRHVQLSAQRH